MERARAVCGRVIGQLGKITNSASAMLGLVALAITLGDVLPASDRRHLLAAWHSVTGVR